MVELSDDMQEKSYFFHWSNPELANRLECSFHTSRGREELERVWPDQRSAMKKLLPEPSPCTEDGKAEEENSAEDIN